MAHHDDVIKWKHFPRYWPFVRGIHWFGKFPAQRPVTQSFDVFFDLCPNKQLSKQPWGWWFETPSWSLWRQCNGYHIIIFITRASRLLIPLWFDIQCIHSLAHPPWTKWPPFCWRNIEMHFCELNVLYFGLDSGLVPNRRQAIIWTNADPIHWSIYMRH